MADFYTYIYHDGDIPIYVGKGKGRRVYDHLKRKDHHPLTQKLAKMKREGREPRIEIHDMPCEDAALELEVLWIALFGRKDLGLGPLLNGTDGGEGTSGRIDSLETKTKRSVAQKESQNRPETKAKRSVTLSKQCTVDEIKIYPSRNALVADLGRGKNGARSPSFRYLENGATHLMN